jgi:hypothetical protein
MFSVFLTLIKYEMPIFTNELLHIFHAYHLRMKK